MLVAAGVPEPKCLRLLLLLLLLAAGAGCCWLLPVLPVLLVLLVLLALLVLLVLLAAGSLLAAGCWCCWLLAAVASCPLATASCNRITCNDPTVNANAMLACAPIYMTRCCF